MMVGLKVHVDFFSCLFFIPSFHPVFFFFLFSISSNPPTAPLSKVHFKAKDKFNEIHEREPNWKKKNKNKKIMRLPLRAIKTTVVDVCDVIFDVCFSSWEGWGGWQTLFFFFGDEQEHKPSVTNQYFPFPPPRDFFATIAPATPPPIALLTPNRTLCRSLIKPINSSSLERKIEKKKKKKIFSPLLL